MLGLSLTGGIHVSRTQIEGWLLASTFTVTPSKQALPFANQFAALAATASIDRRDQSEIIVDQDTGDVPKRHDLADKPGVARNGSCSISLQQAKLYGWLNAAQKALAAELSVVLSFSGFVARWMRRPKRLTRRYSSVWAGSNRTPSDPFPKGGTYVASRPQIFRAMFMRQTC